MLSVLRKRGFSALAAVRSVSVDNASRYRLGEQIGTGFFATVYSAQDLLSSNDNPYLDADDRYSLAVKRINKKRVPTRIQHAEIETLCHLKDRTGKGKKQITQLHDVFETSDHLCLVFECFKGGDMFEFINRYGRLSFNHAKLVMHQLLCATSFLHENQVLHRDIKLENILLASPPHDAYLSVSELINSHGLDLKLADFGYAGLLDKCKQETTGNPAGTYGYVAPEVLRSRVYSPACDMWSLGVVFYALVAAQMPFQVEEGRTGEDAELEAIEFGLNPETWKQNLQQDMFSDEQGVDLLRQLLTADPADRISAKEALAHPWFTSI